MPSRRGRSKRYAKALKIIKQCPAEIKAQIAPDPLLILTQSMDGWALIF